METKTQGASLLDQFAPPRQELVPAPLSGQVISPRPVGAQKVAVLRDERLVLDKLAYLAARAGDAWGYRFPVKNRKAGTQSYVEGPSIKLANELVRVYGNCEVWVDVLDLGTHWKFDAHFLDYETGGKMNRHYLQRKNQASIGGDADRALDAAFQIGQSKAIRNVVTNYLQYFADFAFREARESLVSQIGQKLDAWRKRVLERLAEINVDPGRAAAVIGRGPGDWLAPDVAQLVQMIKAIADGMATIDETFPPIEKEVEAKEEKADAPSASQMSSREIEAFNAGREQGLAKGDKAAPTKKIAADARLAARFAEGVKAAIAEQEEQRKRDARDVREVMGGDDEPDLPEDSESYGAGEGEEIPFDDEEAGE